MSILSSYYDINVHVVGGKRTERLDGFCGFICDVGAAKENQHSLISGYQRNRIVSGIVEDRVENEMYNGRVSQSSKNLNEKYFRLM